MPPKKQSKTKDKSGAGEIVLYQTEDGRTRIECRFGNETLWLSQALIAELFQKDVRTINEHLQNIYGERELRPDATIRKFRIVRPEGSRRVAREILTHAGRISHETALAKAELEFEKFRVQEAGRPTRVDQDFDEVVKNLPVPKRRSKRIIDL